MATSYERMPMEASDVIGLVLAIIAMLGFGAYTIEFLVGFSQLH